MYARLFSPFVITISLIFFTIPRHDAKDNEALYTECTRPFKCGQNNTDFKYPFWGEDRSSECGLQGFKLSCQNNEYISIDMGSDQKFRLLQINESTQEIRIAREYREICPPVVMDTKLNESLFYYNPKSTEDLQLFYGCPPDLVLPKSIDSIRNSTDQTCWGDWIPNSRLFGNQSFSQTQIRNLKSCGTKIRVPVNINTLEKLRTDVMMTLEEVLMDNFLVYYKIIYYETACSDCQDSGGLCWSGTNSSPPTCLCPDGTRTGRCKKKDKSGRILGLKMGIGIGAVASAMLLMCFIYCLGKYLPNNLMAFGKTKSDKDVEAFIRQYGFSTPKRYKYSILKSITNSFKHELGKGGYGKVYKGKLPDGRVVAVKVLNVSKGNGEEFINEVASIGRTSHVNVVALLGFCYEGKRRALIYEFMPNGSLEKFIYGKTSPTGGQHLGWEKLYNIALGIARGLEYLHRGCNTRIVHFDIKPHNILLDKDFCPKISDFGLAKLYTRKESIISMMEARGTIGYIAPEVFNRNFGGVSHKSDVYSYGMMILEMVGGRKNVDAGAIHTSEIYFPRWIYKHIELNKELSLGSAMTIEENEIARKMIIVGLWCIQTNPSQRPSINNVMEMLEGSIAALEIPPKPYLCSPRSGSNSSPQSFSSSPLRS